MKDFVKKNRFNIIVIVVYAIITGIILLFHECGRDEAQAWLIAKNLNLIDMIRQITYEGHPMLWYFILHPFARMGFPYITTKIISWIISVVSVWFILAKSPFDKKMKILFIITSPMLYMYPSISRSYCLIPLAVALVANYYNKRHDKPIQYILSILLLANTHIVLYGMVGILLLFFYIEEIILKRKINSKEQKKKIYMSLCIIIIGLIITIIPIMISITRNADVNLTENLKISDYSINDKIIMMTETALQIIDHIFIGNVVLPFISLLFLMAYEITYHSKNAIIISITTLFHIFVHSFIYSLADQRDVIFIFLIMFIYWIQTEENKKGKYKPLIDICIMILLLLNIVTGLTYVKEEIKGEYSASYETAQYIKENVDIENSVIICTNMPYASAVIPYVDRNIFWSPQIEDYFSFVTWDENFKKEFSVSDLQRKIDENFKDNKKIYLLYTYNLNKKTMEKLEEIGYIKQLFISNIAKRESYIIYEINTN